MKKVLLVVLSIALLFSSAFLVSCKKQEAPEKAPPTGGYGEEKPAETGGYGEEKPAAGGYGEETGGYGEQKGESGGY
jgi:hypothetical protein